MPLLRHAVPDEGGREGAVALKGRDAAAARALVIAPQWIGDAVMSEPLIARLAAQGSRISVAALPWVAPVYAAVPAVSEVIELPFAHGRLDLRARRALGRSWRGRFDIAYVLPRSLKAALLPWFAGVPRRVGYFGEGRFGLLNERLPNPLGRPPMVAYYVALHGAPADASERPRLTFASAQIEGALRIAGVTAGRYFAFMPGAEYGPAKRWPPERYAELARTLHARHRLPVLLLGSAKEAALCGQVAAAAQDACVDLTGALPLRDAMALIAAARGVVSNDSGPMHVAAALGVPQVAVFGSTSPAHTPPLNAHARVVWLKDELRLDCAPCFDRVCRYGHTRCLTGVTANRVDAALAEALSTMPARPMGEAPVDQDASLPTNSTGPVG